MSSAAIILLEQARQARDRAARLRRVAEGLNASHVLEKIEEMARDLEQTADQLERSAAAMADAIARTGDLASELKTTIDYNKELIRRSRTILGRKSD